MHDIIQYISETEIGELYERAIEEDGALDDVTSRLTIPPGARAVGTLRAKQTLILSGIEVAARFFRLYDTALTIEILSTDGTELLAGSPVATITGSAHSLLAVERSALNLLQHLCGIATLTGEFVKTVVGTKAKILDTRKTIPGFRRLEKYAVACGGGVNHRLGLHDAILIKDNHAVAAGGVGKAVLAVKTGADRPMFTEVEVSDPRGLEEAIDAGADRALLDNMELAMIRHCVELAGERIELEVSGNVDLETVGSIAQTGVDFISIGRLTHSAPAADLNMKIVPES
jgi:nicotinate-nucleotide pyrophosphorylase (carboxylating)